MENQRMPQQTAAAIVEGIRERARQCKSAEMRLKKT
jgi:hypothetical protein